MHCVFHKKHTTYLAILKFSFQRLITRTTKAPAYERTQKYFCIHSTRMYKRDAPIYSSATAAAVNALYM